MRCRRGLLVFAMAVSACGSQPASITLGATASPPPTPVPSPTPSPSPPPLGINDVAGALFVAGVGGTEITPGLRHLIVDDRVGGVILFRSNFIDAPGLARWTRDLQALGREAHLPAPLLITLDEEGGDVNQVDSGIPLLPSALSLGARGVAAVRTAVAQTAIGLHGLGLNLDLAPVADLRTNAADRVILDRSFGPDPGVVGPLVSAYVAGLHDGGVGATLKHFPGLGGAPGDPHHAVATDPVDMSAWLRTSAASFAAGIEAGADCVMTTAVYVPGLDPGGRAALFSRPVVTGLLRQRLHFGGVIITDSLSMGGVLAEESLPQAGVDAVNAGNDLLILANSDTALEDSAVQAVRDGLLHGAISESDARASMARVFSLRERYAPQTPSRHALALPGDVVPGIVSARPGRPGRAARARRRASRRAR